MKIFSDKIKYGLAALLELAKNYESSPIQIREIAEAQNIPQNYLEHLLIKLKEADLVESARGRKGGYKLKTTANSIRILDLIEGLDGQITVFENSKTSEVLKIYWEEVKSNFKNLFNATLEDLIKKENVLHERLFYDI
ncbi:MAG: RrF2 family transcriptional regulator [Promethearchaeota archaeon]|jgi:Rrf2 family protein